MAVYLYVGDYDRKPPPKIWAKKEPSYYAARLARKAKAVGTKQWVDYLRLPGVWLLVKVDQPMSASTARSFLEKALKGSVLRASAITVLADPFGLTKGTPLDPEHPLGPALEGPLFEDPPPPLKVVGPPEPRFTIGRSAERPSKWYPDRVEREDAEEIDPAAGMNPQALFMGFYNMPGSHDLEGLRGMRYYVTHKSPFSLQSVATGEADSFGVGPYVVRVTALAKDWNNFAVDVARPLAVAFAKAEGVVFDLYKPLSHLRRHRITTDRNPASSSYGKNKKMREVEVTFEIPQRQLGRLPRDKQRAFTNSWSDGLRWRRKEIDRWLGLDKVETLAAYRAKKR